MDLTEIQNSIEQYLANIHDLNVKAIDFSMIPLFNSSRQAMLSGDSFCYICSLH